MAKKIIQTFIINGEEDFWSIDAQMNEFQPLGGDLYQRHKLNSNSILSESFYTLFGSMNLENGTSVLDKIESLTGIDLNPLKEMTTYISTFELDQKIEMMEKEVFELYSKRAEQTNKKLHGNLETVIQCLNGIIAELEKKKDLSDYLILSDGLEEYYLKDLDKKECNDTTTNLTQDLRKMLRNSLTAKSREIDTTFFVFR